LADRHFDFTVHVHSYLQAQINLADAKAAVIAGVAGGLFVALRDVTGDWRFVAAPNLADVMRALAEVVCFVLLALAVTHAYAALMPRMPDKYRTSFRWLEAAHKALERAARAAGGHIDLIGGGGLVRWPELADREQFPNTTDYATRVIGTPSDDLSRDLAEHCAILARIVAEKYQHLRLAMNYTLVTAFLVASLIFLGVLP
jgi:hypothetical protein